jgi:hypothetical protein
LDDGCLDKVKKIVDKSILSNTNPNTFQLDKNDLESLDIIKVQMKIETERSLNAVDKEIEDQAELDRIKMEEELRNKYQKQKDEFAE